MKPCPGGKKKRSTEKKIQKETREKYKEKSEKNKREITAGVIFS